MKKPICMVLICFATLATFAANSPNFSGKWIFNPGRSKNIGMMSQMAMFQTIKQSSSLLEVTSSTTFQGNLQETNTHYDLSGKAMTNDSPMAGPSETISKWVGDKLVTTWKSKGAVAGTTVVRTETRWLSKDGQTMTLESVRGSQPPVVMVFDKKP